MWSGHNFLHRPGNSFVLDRFIAGGSLSQQLYWEDPDLVTRGRCCDGRRHLRAHSGSLLGLDNSDSYCIHVITIWQFGIMSGWTFTPSQIRIYRPDGIFGDSIISALFSDVCIAVLVLAKTRFRKSTRAVVIALCIVAGTFYYLLAIVGAYLVLARTHYVPIRTKAILVFILVMASLLVLSPLGQSLIDALTLHETVSSRDLKRQLALQQFTNAPVFGIGTGQYAAYEASLNLPANTGLHGTNPHNVYAQVLCENGLVGFVPLIVSLVSAVKLAVKQKNALVAILLFLYIAISWSLGILYSVSFTSFFIVFICSLFENSED